MENSTKKNCFELYGADFMLTPDLKVKECGRCMRVLGNVSNQMEGNGVQVSIIILCFLGQQSVFFYERGDTIVKYKRKCSFLWTNMFTPRYYFEKHASCEIMEFYRNNFPPKLGRRRKNNILIILFMED